MGLRDVFISMTDVATSLANDGVSMQTSATAALPACSYASVINPYLADYSSAISGFEDMVGLELYPFLFIALDDSILCNE